MDTRSGLQALDRKTGGILKKCRAHETEASVERLYLKRKDGGRGLTNLLQQWERTMLSKLRYWERSSDPMVRGVLAFHKDAAAHGARSGQSVLDDISRRYALSREELVNDRGGMKLLVKAQADSLKELLGRKVLHGAHFKTVQSSK